MNFPRVDVSAILSLGGMVLLIAGVNGALAQQPPLSTTTSDGTKQCFAMPDSGRLLSEQVAFGVPLEKTFFPRISEPSQPVPDWEGVDDSGIYQSPDTLSYPDSLDTRSLAADSTLVDGEFFKGDNPNCSICLDGRVAYNISGNNVRLEAERVSNERSGGSSGTLLLELWATRERITGGTVNFFNLGSYRFSNVLSGGFHFPNVSVTVPYEGDPPAGCYYAYMVVREFNNGEFFYRDWQQFDNCLTWGGVNSGGCCGGGGGGTPPPSSGGGMSLANISTNIQIPGEGLFAGFIVRGNGPQQFVVMGEAISQSFNAYLELRNISGQVLASNNDWQTHPTASQIASLIGRNPGRSQDAAFVISLEPGNYVVYLRDLNNRGGLQGIVSVSDVNGFR